MNRMILLTVVLSAVFAQASTPAVKLPIKVEDASIAIEEAFQSYAPHLRGKIEIEVLFQVESAKNESQVLGFLSQVLNDSVRPRTADEYEEIYFKKQLAIKSFGRLILLRPATVFSFVAAVAEMRLSGQSEFMAVGEPLVFGDEVSRYEEPQRSLGSLRQLFVQQLEYFALVKPAEVSHRAVQISSLLNENLSAPLRHTLEAAKRVFARVGESEAGNVVVTENVSPAKPTNVISFVERLPEVHLDLSHLQYDPNTPMRVEFLRLLNLATPILKEYFNGRSYQTGRTQRWSGGVQILEFFKAHQPLFFLLPMATIEIEKHLQLSHASLTEWIKTNLDEKGLAREFDQTVLLAVLEQYDARTEKILEPKLLYEKFGLDSFTLQLRLRNWRRLGLLPIHHDEKVTATALKSPPAESVIAKKKRALKANGQKPASASAVSVGVGCAEVLDQP